MNTSNQALYYHFIAVSSFLGLFSLLMLWPTVLSPPAHWPVSLVLLSTVVPLLLPMRGFFHRCRKSCVWAAYLSLFYFIHGCVEAYANGQDRSYALIEIMLSLLLFLGAAGYVRFAKFSK